MSDKSVDKVKTDSGDQTQELERTFRVNMQVYTPFLGNSQDRNVAEEVRLKVLKEMLHSRLKLLSRGTLKIELLQKISMKILKEMLHSR